MAEAYFKTSFKGYDTKQVDEFIISLSDKYEENEKQLSEEIRALKAENESLRDEISQLNQDAEAAEEAHLSALDEKQKEYDALCAEIGERMVVADKRAEEIIKNAEKEASLILTKARQESENQARMMRFQAEAEASKIIEETQKQCASISAAAEEFRARQNEMSKSMFETEKRFGDALNKLKAGFGSEAPAPKADFSMEE